MDVRKERTGEGETGTMIYVSLSREYVALLFSTHFSVN